MPPRLACWQRRPSVPKPLLSSRLPCPQDRLNARRVTPDEAIRALSAAGVALSVAEIAQVKAAYTDEAGSFSYDALLGDGAWRSFGDERRSPRLAR